MTLSAVNGLTATFTMPAFGAGRVYLTVPGGVVVSEESQDNNEEYHFTTATFWHYEGACRASA